MVTKIYTTLVFLTLSIFSYSQSKQFAWNFLSEDQKEMKTAYCLPNNDFNKNYLQEEGIKIKYETSKMIYFTATANQLSKAIVEDKLDDFYIEYSPPHLMNDTARAVHHVDEVHMGTGLPGAYQGEGVIIGVVDTGLDWTHPDFYDEEGNTRVIRYWDHSTNTGGPLSSYGYGIVWDSTAINNMTCISTDNHSHGTTVAGTTSGNGFAGQYNQGMAPKSSIIVVESNFSLPNWTMTVADACDYIFKVADTLGMPAVVNLSLGTYFGSHDGNDPAADYIESLLDEKDGRIVVAAAGNSGAKGKYHAHAEITSETSFIWFINNPSGSLGANTVFFDLWSDAAEATWNYTFSAVNPTNNFETRGETVSRLATSSIGVPVYDTIWNGSNRIATLQIYTSYSGGAYHMQGFVSKLDTISYNIGFNTSGSGSYDLWTGQWLGYNNIQQSLPDEISFPDIVRYNHPDTLQSIVSSWNCSEKVISVGNIQNRFGFPSFDGGYYTNTGSIPPGKLSINSSKGPSRHNVYKPDIVACGDVTLTPGPIWFVTNPGNFNKVDTTGWYMANGGTSMSCPVVSGIAALYLERCQRGNYASFMNDMMSTAFPNAFSGTLPDNAFGYGLINAHDLLLINDFEATIAGDTSLCADPNVVTVSGTTTISTVEWSNSQVGISADVSEAGWFYGTAFNNSGCGVPTDSLEFVQLEVPVIDPIIVDFDNQILTTNSSTDYQWTLDGADIGGEIGPTLNISEPYGLYTCYAVSADGCIASTDPVGIYVGIEELKNDEIVIFPNPVINEFQVGSVNTIEQLTVFNQNGQQIKLNRIGANNFSVRDLAPGVYYIELISEGKTYISKFVKE